MNTIIASSAPSRPDLPSTFVPPTAEKKAAMRAHIAQVIMERHAAGLHADGRVLDFVKYAAHLKASRA